MDSPGFYAIVKNYTSLNDDEYKSLKNLSQEYPYCQIISLLNARAAQDLNHSDKERLLHSAALYSTERGVLKQVMTAPRKERIAPAPVQVTIPVPSATPIETPEPAVIIDEIVEVEVEVEDKHMVYHAPPEPAEILLTGDDLINDIYAELEKLKEHKMEFALSVEEFEKLGGQYRAGQKAIPEKEPAAEPLIEEIKSTKKKIKIDNPKQKEQNEIIDKFIKIQPSIPKPKATAAASDLAEDSGMFSDNIVSETLVGILLKQGKKEKAIEVLKKLIWKFPQKKAYFAAQIDSLKS